MKIYLSMCLALAMFHVALGRPQSPINGDIPIHQVSTAETELPNIHSQHQIDTYVAMVKTAAKMFLQVNGTTEIEERFFPFLPIIIPPIIKIIEDLVIPIVNKLKTEVLQTQEENEKFEIGVVTVFGVNNTVNSTIQMLEKTFLPSILPLIPAIIDLIPTIVDVVIPIVNDFLTKEVLPTQEPIKKFEIDVARGLGVNNTGNSTIQMGKRSWISWIAEEIAKPVIPVVIGEVKKLVYPEN